MNPAKLGSKPTHISMQHFGFHSTKIFISSSALTMTSFVSTHFFFFFLHSLSPLYYENSYGVRVFLRAQAMISTICIPCAPRNRPHSLLLFTVVGWVPLLFHIILVIITLKMCIILKSLPWNLCATNVYSVRSLVGLFSSRANGNEQTMPKLQLYAQYFGVFVFLFGLSWAEL